MGRYILKLDIDWIPPKRWLNDWIKTRKKLLEHVDIWCYSVIWHKSTSGKGLHVWLKVTTQKMLKDNDLNRLQFLCGDDVTRVRINYLRVKRKVKDWNKLFSKVLWKRKPPKRGDCSKCSLYRFMHDLQDLSNEGIKDEKQGRSVERGKRSV